MDPHKDPRGYTSSFFKSNHAITMIEQIWQAKPLSTDYLGMKDIRFHESDKSYPPISVYNTLAAVHDSHFRGNRIDVDTVGELGELLHHGMRTPAAQASTCFSTPKPETSTSATSSSARHLSSTLPTSSSLRHPIRSRFSRAHGRPHVLIVDQLVARLL
jgi:hypothetical protein